MFGKILACIALVVTSVRAADPAPLFNGKDFTGWTFDNIDPKIPAADIWSVSNGVIVCKGRPPGILRTVKDYGDYELTLEWRWPAGMKSGNSGVLIHCGEPRQTFVWPQSIEIQLAQGDAGDFWTIGRKLTVAGTKPQGRRWPRSGKSPEKPAGQWNSLRVRCQGDSMSVWINGTLVNQATALSATRGAICLQGEGGEVRFRKILLTPLAPAAADSR